MRSQCAARTCNLDSRFEPDFGVIVVILRPLSYMNTSSVLVKRIKTVKPKNETACSDNSGTHLVQKPILIQRQGQTSLSPSFQTQSDGFHWQQLLLLFVLGSRNPV